MTPEPSPSPTPLTIPSAGPTTWDTIAQWVSIGLLATGALIFIIFVAEKIFSWNKKREIKPFYLWLAAIAVFGGLLSFFLPIAINSGFNKDDDGSRLRQALLYTTGGLLGVITLGETHRKNDQEKEKNDQDHARQVHAERRARYTKAIEQLADQKAPVRLGGIYTLFGLADEWLTDNLIKESTRTEETQIIINNLCAYIRGPLPKKDEKNILKCYPLETLGQFQKSKEANLPDHLKEEAEIRKTIIKEIKERISPDIYQLKNDWSNFHFNFSNSVFFYEVDFFGCTFKNSVNFSNSLFATEANFINTAFHNSTDFSKTKFRASAYFSHASHRGFGQFNFQEAQFQSVSFQGVEFEGVSSFFEAKFNMLANFEDSIFHTPSYFSYAKFNTNAHFLRAIFCNKVSFTQATFGENEDFKPLARCTNFTNATFIDEADFSGAKFYATTDFSSASFYAFDPNFKGASFLGSIKIPHTTTLLHIQHVFPERHSTPFYITTERHLSPYGDLYYIPDGAELLITDLQKKNKKQPKKQPKKQQAHNFAVHEDSQPIHWGEAELDGVKYRIPVGTVLFDPSSGETSKPAKPLDKSNDGEEDKSE